MIALVRRRAVRNAGKNTAFKKIEDVRDVGASKSIASRPSHQPAELANEVCWTILASRRRQTFRYRTTGTLGGISLHSAVGKQENQTTCLSGQLDVEPRDGGELAVFEIRAGAEPEGVSL